MQRPLSDEEVAAKEARLRELRSQLNELNAAPSSSRSPPPECSNLDPYNDDGAPCSDDSEDEEDEFLQEAERAQEGVAGVHMYAKPMDELLGATLETGPNARRSTVGDFELLRLAKMGDVASFMDFADFIGVDPTTFRDNHMRNALHYAADSGCIPLLQYLIEKKVPFEKDERMMTPIDIAALNQHEAAVKLLMEAFPEAAGVVKNHEEAVESFAQPPPRFTMTKPAPHALKETRIRAFWKTGDSASAVPTPASSVATTVFRLTEKHHDLVVRALSGSSLAHDSQGFNNWLPPAESETLVAVLPRTKMVGVVQTVGAHEAIQGLVAAVPLGGSIVGNKGQIRVNDPVLVTQLVLHPTLRGANVAAMLLEELQRLLKDAETTAVVFRSALQLPVQAIGLLKWSRRSIAPCSVFRRQYAMDVFPDFYHYDDVLRADITAKNAVARSFHDRMATHRANWCAVDHTDSNQLKLLHEFVVSHAANMFDIAYVPGSTDDVLASLIVDGLSPFVYVSPTTGAITDLVVLRLRNSEGLNNELKSVAMCVYALFTSFKRSEKAEEVLVLCEMLNCETVLIPNMFGFLDSDLSGAKFEELLACREYLYVLSSRTEAAAQPTPLSKVAIPCAFI